jgi:hypothetical protein
MKNKNKIYFFTMLLALPCFIFSCSGPKEKITGQKMSWDSLSDSSLNGKMVTIEGYPRLPLIMSSSEDTGTVHLLEREHQYNGRAIILHIPIGNGENSQSKLPDQYEESDLVIHDRNGEKITYGQKMRITGRASIRYTKYFIAVESIEKINDPPFDFIKAGAVHLNDSSDLEMLDKKFVYAEGVIRFSEDQEYKQTWVDMIIDDETLSDEVYCKIEYGTGTNQVIELPDPDTDKGTVLLDKDRKKIAEGSRVRIFGVWNAEDEFISVEQIVYAGK